MKKIWKWWIGIMCFLVVLLICVYAFGWQDVIVFTIPITRYNYTVVNNTPDLTNVSIVAPVLVPCNLRNGSNNITLPVSPKLSEAECPKYITNCIK